MKTVFVPIAMLAIAASPANRSSGFAGSTPVGLDGHVALATLDCAAIGSDPRRGRVRTPLADGCRVALPSPNGRLVVRTTPAPDGSTTLIVTGGLAVKDLNQPTIFLWKPDSTGFFLNGGEGSGQSSQLRFFHRTAMGWQRSDRLAAAASAMYRRRFDCRGGRASYTNSSGWDWTQTGLLRMVIQEGVHSKGCLRPHADRTVLFEVIGDPITGRIASAREIAALR